MQIPKYSQYNYRLPLTVGYEIDIWGTNHLKTKSVGLYKAVGGKNLYKLNEDI